MGNSQSACCFRPVGDLNVVVTNECSKSSARPKAPEKCAIDSTAIPSDLILNALNPEDGPAAGLPYQVHYLGPPVPACEAERAKTAEALHAIDHANPNDPEIMSILKLTKSMFKAPVALVALFETKRVYVAQEEGGVIPVGDFPWRFTLCAWSLAYNNAQILVIPDTLQDARFRENDKVTNFPKVRFYCGAPLIASNGHRLGTLCFADVEPRPGFDAASCSVMNNLSELVVRHLEKDIALKLKERDNEVLQHTYGHLQRTLDCFDHCVVLLDTSTEGWTIMHLNATFTKLTGIERSDVLGKGLCDVFDGFQGMAIPNTELRGAAAQCLDFQVTSTTIKAHLKPEGGAARPFVLTFRPAAREGLDDSTMPIGIPAFLKPNTTGTAAGSNGARKYYFMSIDTVKPDQLAGLLAARKSNVSVASSSIFTSSSNTETVDGLELGHLLGKGSFGSVYYGSWMGTPVAVKVIDHDCGTSAVLDGTAFEAVLGKELRHPNVVQTLKYVHRKMMRMHNGTCSISYSSSSLVSSSRGLVKDWGGSKSNLGKPEAVPEAPSEPEEELTSYIKKVSSTKDSDTVKKNVKAAADPGQVLLAMQQDAEKDAAAETDHKDAAAGKDEPDKGMLSITRAGVKAPWPVIHFDEAVMGTGNSVDWPAVGPKESCTTNCKGSAKWTSSSNADTASTANTASGGQTWLLLEYCDKGCLQEAIDRGWLRTERSALKGGPNMIAVVATALEIARAMAYLHSHNVVHGDLSSWNCMLCSSGAQAGDGGRNFVAKVGDFGLARALDVRSRIETRTYGTLTHMPPETLLKGIISTSTDVYSYGVLLWQIYTSSRPWAGLTHSQIIMLVASQGAKLQFPDDTPAAYKQLALECMATHPDARPSFEAVVHRLDALLADLEEAAEAARRAGRPSLELIDGEF